MTRLEEREKTLRHIHRVEILPLEVLDELQGEGILDCNFFCEVIEKQTLWGQTVCRVCLPNQDAATRP